jgi:hypothetical protein
MVTGQGGGEKLAVLPPQWQPLVKLFSQLAGRIRLKSSLRLLDINQKDEPGPASGIALICGPGPLVKRILHRLNEHLKITAFIWTIRKC